MYFFASFHYNIQTYYICASLVLVYILNVQQISHVQSKVGVLFWNCDTRHVILLSRNSSPNMIIVARKKLCWPKIMLCKAYIKKNFYSIIKSCYARFYIRKMRIPKSHAMENHVMDIHVRQGYCCTTYLQI